MGAVQGGPGLVTRPHKLASAGIKRLIERAIWAQGLRKRLENGYRKPYNSLIFLKDCLEPTQI